MDTPLSEAVIKRGKYRLAIILTVAFMLIIVAILAFQHLFASTISRQAIATASVTRGTVENTLSASGVVLPEFEEVITSPISASVQKVMLNPGSRIKTGQSVLTLDKSASQTEFEKLGFQLESKRNDIKKLKLELDKSFYDVKSNNDIKQLRINSLEADVDNAKRLYKAGGGTREDIEKAELNLRVAKLEKQQLENEIKSRQQTMQVEEKEAEIAAAIQEGELRELSRKLKLASIVASRDGVVTWVNKNIGAAVHEGDPLARIADLGSFKVQGSIADNYLDQLHSGMPAIIRINDNEFRGTIVNIQPSVQNGIVLFDVAIGQENNKLLRPDMKVDVYPVTAVHNNIMRVANGPAFGGASAQEIFVVINGEAVRRKVHTGLTNFDFVELLDNVHEGDVIITSDLSAYKNAQVLKIK